MTNNKEIFEYIDRYHFIPKYTEALTTAGMSQAQAKIFVEAQVQILVKVDNIEIRQEELFQELKKRIDIKVSELETKLDDKIDKLDDKIDAVSTRLIRNMMFGFGIVTIVIIVFKFI